MTHNNDTIKFFSIFFCQCQLASALMISKDTTIFSRATGTERPLRGRTKVYSKV
jgi:hypothetical protein